jgi:KipI family sensor histidine kinase inhibitor
VEPRIGAFGEAALLVEFGDSPDLALNARVHALARQLETAALEAQTNLIPGYVSLLVEFDPLRVDLEEAHSSLERAVYSLEMVSLPLGRRRVIPTVYGGEWGPDLDEVAARAGLSAAEVVARHTAPEQTVYMLGFSPGFPYLGDLPPELSLPRRQTPRERVPTGSVAIAERQTGIYSREMPGGWHVLGRTPVVLFDESHDPPAYLSAGDRVRFVEIPANEWDRYAGAPSDW